MGGREEISDKGERMSQWEEIIIRYIKRRGAAKSSLEGAGEGGVRTTAPPRDGFAVARRVHRAHGSPHARLHRLTIIQARYGGKKMADKSGRDGDKSPGRRGEER